MSAHYAACADKMYAYVKNTADAYGDLYVHAAQVFELMAQKCDIAEKLVPMYKSGDREGLRAIVKTSLPKLKKCIETVHAVHRRLWNKYYKPFGWSALDVRYAGIAARCDTAIERIGAYLDGEIPTLEELDEPRLPKKFTGFLQYKQISGPGIM